MATEWDIRVDPNPVMLYRRSNAKHADLDTALLATANPAYTQAKLNTMPKNDKIYAARAAGLTGIPGV